MLFPQVEHWKGLRIMAKRNELGTIGGVHPAEYAARWGDGQTADGALFYNCSTMDKSGKVVPRHEWTAKDWDDFSKAVGRLRDRVYTATGWPKNPNGWTRKDHADLGKLQRWAIGLRDKMLEARVDSVAGSYVDEMTEAYIECALWTAPEDMIRPTSGQFDASPYLSRIPKETREEARAECLTFYTKHHHDLDGWDGGQAGHDLWLSRNGHGTGFFDRSELGEKDARERLQTAARALPERSIYVGRGGWIKFD